MLASKSARLSLITFSLIPLLFTPIASLTAQAQKFTVLYRFKGGIDGAVPSAGVLRDAQGNLFGTTLGGGASNNGTLFELTGGGREKILYSFRNQPDGSGPSGGLLQVGGSFYGTTYLGGDIPPGGTVWEVKSNGAEKVLAALPLDADGGGYPEAGLIRDAQGNLYGTTSGYNGGYGNGAVFKISPTGALTILYSFSGGVDGLCPLGTLLRDSSGNLYGTTSRGGTYGYGTVFRVTPTGVETVLYSFTGGADGGFPAAGLIRNARGDFFGTTSSGGRYAIGTVFKVTSSGIETVLHTFVGGRDGSFPGAALVLDKSGNVYGTTVMGGRYDKGTVFKISTSGKEVILHSFTGGTDGGSPGSSLVLDQQNNLYGTTTAGGTNLTVCIGGCGVIFKIH